MGGHRTDHGAARRQVSGRPGRLAKLVVDMRGHTIGARCRSVAMRQLAATLSATGVSAHIEAREPDGARWSMTIVTAQPPHE